MKLNCVQYNALRKYQDIIKRAYTEHYYRALPVSDFDRMYEIYQQLGMGSVCRTCGESVLNMLSRLGQAYIIYEETKENKDDNSKKRRKLQDNSGGEV